MKTRVVAVLALLLGGLLAVFLPPFLMRIDAKDEPLLPADAVWSFKYDLHLDGEVKGDVAEITWRLAVRNSRITGVPAVFTPGDPNTDHRLGGEIVPGKVPVLVLRQDGPGNYVCIYTCRLVADRFFLGTWFDNGGVAGDFEMSPVPSNK
jgi:hypothetical protein